MSEYQPVLASLPLHNLFSIRDELFLSAASRGLTAEGDVLVSRRDTRKNPLCHRLADDVIALTVCLKNYSPVPRSLLKNGKRKKDYLELSRQSEIVVNSQLEPPATAASSSCPVTPRPAPAESVSVCDTVRFSSMMREINLLRSDVNGLKRDVSLLNRNCQSQPSTALDTCHIKVYFPSPASPVLNPVQVSRLLGCPVLLVTRISAKSIKVKIPKISLLDCLQSSDPTSHLVYVWKNHVSCPSSRSSLRASPSSQHLDSIQIATWNCRGLQNSITYIKHLLSRGVDILVLQEHWLWPFELDQLGSIDPHFAYIAVCDHRLSPSSRLTRGCGGCAILWRKSIPAVPVSLLESDWICSIQVPFEGCQLPLTIVGVYMPSSEYPQETYNEYFNGINQALSALPLSSPLLLVGDLNCHIGKLGGPRSSSDPNQRGVQWMDLVHKHSLYIPSLSLPWQLALCTLSTRAGLLPLSTMPLAIYPYPQSSPVSLTSWSMLHSPPFRPQNTLRGTPTRYTTLIYQHCVGKVVLLSVSGKQQAPLDLAHSMTKERTARKMSESTSPNGEPNFNEE